MADQVGVTAVGAPGVLTMDVVVSEYFYSGGDTHIRLYLGDSCFLSFVIKALVEVPKYIHFEAQSLRRIKE